ncbi:hypothetical protein KM043_000171 [Ampulex compressa]|nr:hypothetical protein KM043_000171 [Ampulex compressa]
MSGRSTEARPFHSSEPAHGMRNYDLGGLSKRQKALLNRKKTALAMENEIYWHGHPMAGRLIFTLLRHVLRTRPTTGVHEAVGDFFNRPYRRLLIDVTENHRLGNKVTDVADTRDDSPIFHE